MGTDITPGSMEAPALRPGRGRRPAGQVRAVVLDAAASQLFEAGLTSVTFEKIASRAGVSKMTLYKWWPSPGALALDAYFVAVEQTLAFPDTGDVAADLRTQLHAFVRVLSDEATGPVIAALVGAAQTDPELAAAFNTRYTHPRRQLAVDRLAVARRRGQVRDDVHLEVVVDQLWGACYHRLLLPDQPLDARFADALVDNLLRGIAP
jgi:AcrR family transcriptional regulator